ncbi:MAG: YqiA/YcfP family alpha/beta fold hydrolase [Sporomusaceae bacterium]|nr:YqiA/YcfP family alpha/beta fold hydrolase [Sporomusaceae bacterium]
MEDISIQSRLGTLAGVLHPASGAEADSALVICHGFRGSKDGGGRAIMLADAVASLGVTVVRFDFTPHETLTQQIVEIGSVVEFCRECIGTRIFLLGRSMGGSAALAFAARDGGVAGLCLWATPWDLAETFQLSLGEHYHKLAQGEGVVLEDEYGRAALDPKLIADMRRYDLRECVRSLTDTPLLILHGDKDAVVPLRQARTLYQLATGPKQLIVIEGGDHQLAGHYEQSQRALLSWLKPLLPKAGE